MSIKQIITGWLATLTLVAGLLMLKAGLNLNFFTIAGIGAITVSLFMVIDNRE